jgi:hypothetical protein
VRKRRVFEFANVPQFENEFAWSLASLELTGVRYGFEVTKMSNTKWKFGVKLSSVVPHISGHYAGFSFRAAICLPGADRPYKVLELTREKLPVKEPSFFFWWINFDEADVALENFRVETDISHLRDSDDELNHDYLCEIIPGGCLPALNVCSNLSSMLKDDQMIDIEFVVGPEQRVFKAHKLVLSAGSQVFRAQFHPESGFKSEKQLRIEDADGSAFARFLNFLYGDASAPDLDYKYPSAEGAIAKSGSGTSMEELTREESAKESIKSGSGKEDSTLRRSSSTNETAKEVYDGVHVIDLLSIAHKYEARCLLDVMQERISAEVCLDNCAEYMFYADMFSLESLQNKVSAFIMKDAGTFSMVRKSKYFKRLSKDAAFALLDRFAETARSDSDEEQPHYEANITLSDIASDAQDELEMSP